MPGQPHYCAKLLPESTRIRTVTSSPKKGRPACHEVTNNISSGRIRDRIHLYRCGKYSAIDTHTPSCYRDITGIGYFPKLSPSGSVSYVVGR
jgi:hypothetical protein